MFIVYRKYKYQNKVYNISLWDIWKKIHISNEYSKLKKTNSLWKVSTKFKALFRLCFVCYAIILIALYTVFIIDLTIEPSGNLFYIFLNLLIMISPLFLIELGLTFLVPLQIQRKEKIQAS